MSETFEDYSLTLLQVVTNLRSAGLIINVEKSHFARKEVKYLGHIIGHGVVRTDPDKIKKVFIQVTPKGDEIPIAFMSLITLPSNG